MCCTTNGDDLVGGAAEALREADVLSAASAPGPGTIKKEWVAGMAKDAIVFLTANPVPEMWPWDAQAAGARIVGTGRSDFPNQINSSLGFPGIFRGVLDVRAERITDSMCLAAAFELAECAEAGGLNERHIVPRMDDHEVSVRVAVAVGMRAVGEGVARIALTRDRLIKTSADVIERARRETRLKMEEGVIPAPPTATRKKGIKRGGLGDGMAELTLRGPPAVGKPIAPGLGGEKWRLSRPVGLWRGPRWREKMGRDRKGRRLEPGKGLDTALLERAFGMGRSSYGPGVGPAGPGGCAVSGRRGSLDGCGERPMTN